jgi:hypothetical protein
VLSKVVFWRNFHGNCSENVTQRTSRSVSRQILVTSKNRKAILLTLCDSNHPNLLGYFVISKVTRAGKVIHIRIKHFPGGTFCVEGTDQEYGTLQQLVQTSQYLHLEMDKVKMFGLPLLSLLIGQKQKAANNSKFWSIFTRTAQNQQVVGYANPDEPYMMELVHGDE